MFQNDECRRMRIGGNVATLLRANGRVNAKHPDMRQWGGRFGRWGRSIDSLWPWVGIWRTVPDPFAIRSKGRIVTIAPPEV